MNIQNPSAMKPGEARTPGQSTKDIILRDPIAAPEPIVTERYEFLGDADISFDRYTSRAFFDLEMKKLWPKVWQFVCREEHIPEPGDHIVYEIGDYSFIVTRTDSGEIKAFYNSCLHRGTQLRPGRDEEGYALSGNDFRCPFHAWTWNMDGTLKDLPCEWDFPHLDKDKLNLPEAKVGTWGGFVFMNMDPNARPLEEHLEVLPEHFKHFFPMDRRYIEVHLRRTLPCNWKAAAEAFIEAYHVRETHMAGSEIGNAQTNAQYDVFGDNVTRFIHTRGYLAPKWPEPETEEDIANSMAERIMAAEAKRKEMQPKYGVDLSEFSESEMLDSIEYFLFPNMFIFPGIGLPMIYRFRPAGNDVDTCWFDLMFLRPLNDGEEHPEPPRVVKLDVHETYAQVPNMDQPLAVIYEQDTSNLERQQRGFKSSYKQAESLANYQEVRIRQLHITLDKYMNARD
jgi:phenylpropionate dioxygenase-like ring-hydroxylating dioxygenase large terminal subunit